MVCKQLAYVVDLIPAPASQLHHQVGGKKPKKPQTLKLDSEKALAIPSLEVSLIPGIDTHTHWSSPVQHSL